MQSRSRVAALLLASTILTAPAWAQTTGAATPPNAVQTAQAASEAQANPLQEVVITAARRRNENVQTTPVAITAITTHALERAHVTNFDQIGDLAPNLQIEKNPGSNGVANIYLRGFGQYTNDPAADPHVAVFVDGVYLPAPVGTLFDTFDLAQVEVAAGPQGTLAGKNAAVGAIYLTHAKPTGEFGGEIEGDYGSYDHFGARAKIDVPILRGADGSSILAASASIVEKEGGNWIYNVANGKRDMGGENNKTGRFSLAFTPDSAFEWYLSSVLSTANDPQPGAEPVNFLGGRPGTPSSVRQINPLPCTVFAATIQKDYGVNGCQAFPFGTTDTTFTDREHETFGLVSSTINYRFEPVTVTAVTGFNGYWLSNNFDDGGTPYPALWAYHSLTRYDEESQELRFSSNKGGGWTFGDRLDWVVGGYYSNFDYNKTNNLGINAFGLPQGTVNTYQTEHGTTTSEAVFVHLIYNFTDQWTGNFGVRQSWDQKTHGYAAGLVNPKFNFDIPAGYHNTSFEAGTAYRFDPHRMAYFRFAQGYQSGGFSGFTIGDNFAPETNNSYEVGFKSDWLDQRLRVNLDLFENDISQLQVASAIVINTAPGYLQATFNAGSARVEGMEAQVYAVPINDLTTHLNIGYLHTRYNKNFSTVCSNVTGVALDCSGVPFAEAPRWTINLGGDYTMELPDELGTAVLGADWVYKSSLYTGDPPYPSSLQDGYGIVNLSLTLTDPTDRYSVEFYGTNVLDRPYQIGYTDPSGLAAWETLGRPAEWGLRLTAKFGQPG